MGILKVASACMNAQMDKTANLRKMLDWMELAA